MISLKFYGVNMFLENTRSSAANNCQVILQLIVILSFSRQSWFRIILVTRTCIQLEIFGRNLVQPFDILFLKLRIEKLLRLSNLEPVSTSLIRSRARDGENLLIMFSVSGRCHSETEKNSIASNRLIKPTSVLAQLPYFAAKIT